MNRLKRSQAVLALFCLCLSLLPLANISVTRAAPAEAQAEIESTETFKFTKVDLDLLEQVNLIDRQFDKEGLVYNDAELNAYLTRVGRTVLPTNSNLENVKWKFRVLRDPIPNAFALPNGSIYLNSGLLALLDDEAQLASVLAHEEIHVINRHSYLQNRSTRKKVLATNIISVIGFWNPIGGVAGMAIDLLATISPFMLQTSTFGYSRELEKEADTEGLRLLASAGYDPQEMASALKLLEKDIEGEQLKYFYSDHPQLKERIAYLDNMTNGKALKSPDREPVNTPKAEYLSTIEKATRHDVQLAINAGRYRTAVYLSQKLVDFDPRSSDNFFYLAESYRALGPRAPELTEQELTTDAKKRALKKKEKLTMEEEESELAATPEGQKNWKNNQQRAEKFYFRAIEFDSSNYQVYRGLGMLYEKAQRKPEAAREYQRYLDRAPEASDKERIRRRLATLKAS